MSCYMINQEHAEFLANAAREAANRSPMRSFGFWNPERGERETVRTGEPTPAHFATMLLRDNARSVRARYGESAAELGADLDIEHEPMRGVRGWTGNPSANEATVPQQAAAVFMALDCYQYQACEAPSWSDSASRSFCDSLRAAWGRILARWAGVERWDVPPLVQGCWNFTAEADAPCRSAERQQ